MLRTVQSNGQIAEELTLVHDSVALALERWRALDAQERFRAAESQRRQEIRKVKKLEEEVTKSQGAYSELLKSITSSALVSAANIVVAILAFITILVTDGEKIIEPIHAVLSSILPEATIIRTVLEYIIEFSFAGVFALVIANNLRDFIKRITIVEFGVKKSKSSRTNTASDSKKTTIRVAPHRKRK
jgi:uncharacterized protein (UPF0335 family)